MALLLEASSASHDEETLLAAVALTKVLTEVADAFCLAIASSSPVAVAGIEQCHLMLRCTHSTAWDAEKQQLL